MRLSYSHQSLFLYYFVLTLIFLVSFHFILNNNLRVPNSLPLTQCVHPSNLSILNHIDKKKIKICKEICIRIHIIFFKENFIQHLCNQKSFVLRMNNTVSHLN